MRWIHKTFVLFGLGFLFFSIVATYLSVQNFLRDNSATLKQTLTKEVSLIAQLAQMDIRQLGDQLTWIYSQRNAPAFESMVAQVPFKGLWAFEAANNSKESPLVWSYGEGLVEWMKVAQQTVAQTKNSAIEFRRLTSSKGEVSYLVMKRLQNTHQNTDNPQVVLSGVLPLSHFQGWVAAALGTSREMVVVDREGFSLAYTNQQYAGASLLKHPVIERVVQQSEPQITFEEKNLKGVNAYYASEQLAGTNLSVVSIQQEPDYFKVWSETWFDLSGYTLAFLLIFGGLLYRFSIPVDKSLDYFSNMVIALNSRAPLAYPEFSADEVLSIEEPLSQLIEDSKQGGHVLSRPTESNQDSEKDKSHAESPSKIQELERSLALSLKAPLYAIVGSIQKVIPHVKEKDLLDHLYLIEAEAKNGRKSIDQWFDLIDPKENSREKIELRTIFDEIFQEFKPQLDQNKIQVETHLNSDVALTSNKLLLKRIFNELIQNAIEALSITENKLIRIEIETLSDRLKVVLTDSGVGMAEEQQKQAFEPFFTSKPGEREGLGLTMVRGWVTHLSGKIRFESKLGEGTRVEIELPFDDANLKLNGAANLLNVDVETKKRDTSELNIEPSDTHKTAPEIDLLAADQKRENNAIDFIRLTPKLKPKSKPKPTEKPALQAHGSNPNRIAEDLEEMELKRLIENEILPQPDETPSPDILHIIRKPVVRVKG